MSGRLAILIRRIGPYHRARLEALKARANVAVVEFAPKDNTYQWDCESTLGFDRAVISPDGDPYGLPFDQLRRKTFEILSSLNPTKVLIPGWTDRIALMALLWCHENQRPAILMSDSQAADAHRWWWKEAVKRRLLSYFSAAVTAGSPHVAYLRQLGMRSESIFTGYDVVDNQYFATQASNIQSQSSTVRAELGLPNKYFLATSRFIEKKNLIRLVTAFARFRETTEGADWKLVLMGDGPLRGEIETTAHQLGVTSELVLTGFRQYHELPFYYSLASAFVHASTVDQWGLVVNEAMASRLPVIVSVRCGCALDLVRNGVNGFAFDPFDTNEMARCMAAVASSSCDRQLMGTHSETIIAQWNLNRFADAVLSAVSCPPVHQPMSFFDHFLIRLLSRRSA